jgi:hypothetical protein
MHYKLYRYELANDENEEIHPDRHFKLFDNSKGKDDLGRFTEYRGKKNAVLMHIRHYQYDFIGLVGRHSTERKVTVYDPGEDLTSQVDVDDDDYPNTAFVCFPRIHVIACLDRATLRADTAMSRLHSIIRHRQKLWFNVTPITESFDLRKATQRFRLVDVTFELWPVNPHTEDIGAKLDESSKLDHIKKLNGSAHGAISEPLTLNGGFLTAVQQLQKSGHAKVGFKAYTQDKKLKLRFRSRVALVYSQTKMKECRERMLE